MISSNERGVLFSFSEKAIFRLLCFEEVAEECFVYGCLVSRPRRARRSPRSHLTPTTSSSPARLLTASSSGISARTGQCAEAEECSTLTTGINMKLWNPFSTLLLFNNNTDCDGDQLIYFKREQKLIINDKKMCFSF